MKTFLYPKDLYPFESKWVTLNGSPIHYIDEGKGETILFCHPPVASSFMYRNMIKELAKTTRCIALDFPGFGLSEAKPGYIHSIRSQAEVVDTFIHELQLKPLYLLMQECGGHAAMSVFMKKPELLKGIILTSTIPFPVSDYPRIKTMLNCINSTIVAGMNVNFNFIVRALTKFGIRNRKLSREERAVYKTMFHDKSLRKASTHLLHQLVVEEDLLRGIQRALETVFKQKPILLIYGEHDPLTKMKIPHRIKEMLPHAELHFIAGEAHFPHEGDPQKMNELILTWMKQLV